MKVLNSFKKRVLELENESFETLALDIFRFQAEHNLIYQKYISLLGKNYTAIKELGEIPFLPIEFFKTHKIVTGKWGSETTFLSSATTSIHRSKHEIEDVHFYNKLSSNIFKKFYKNIKNTAFLALLPSYIEQGNSSLINMVSYFINSSDIKESGFYLNNFQDLINTINLLNSRKINIVLFGVTYALLDLAMQKNLNFSGITVIETGGMKGKRQEISKNEVHELLKEKLNLKNIHSEYGMTELLSQAYSKQDGVFETPTSMKIIIRDLNDPFTYITKSKSGGINVIDLANIHSCSFIETKDIGMIMDENKFKILGRFDNSDIRGCNLLLN